MSCHRVWGTGFVAQARLYRQGLLRNFLHRKKPQALDRKAVLCFLFIVPHTRRHDEKNPTPQTIKEKFGLWVLKKGVENGKIKHEESRTVRTL